MTSVVVDGFTTLLGGHDVELDAGIHRAVTAVAHQMQAEPAPTQDEQLSKSSQSTLCELVIVAVNSEKKTKTFTLLPGPVRRKEADGIFMATSLS